MRILSVGFRAVVSAVLNGGSVWPAVTVAVVSLLVAAAVFAVRSRRGDRSG
ncbi:hypothetical protein [Kitasatospora sp. GP82]|uniref:hypothetical protein n=1 Tax=Kitasatospora sp. GP82 TaxID=3035089 RepID=UPI002474E93D|nr:hypothetical protein [Kitasatospora sp. GP82]MDH6123989.1 hypothetical protein [Kitasatospora sp. GP82]